MISKLDAVEARVLGCLIEKEITTPEYYPLTLNALVNASNQKSNRSPVVAFDDETVQDALDRLRHHKLVLITTGGGNRVPKYGHRLQDNLNLGRREVALLCELLLRGPQTLGELKDRASRMQRFSDLEEVDACLRTMIEYGEGPLVVRLPRLPGMKEDRYAHLLSGEVTFKEEFAAEGPVFRSATDDRIQTLEAEIAALRDRINGLERDWLAFKQQFD